MSKYLFLRKLFFVHTAIFLFGVNVLAQTITYTYNFTGYAQSFTVPACVTTLTLGVNGAQGGTNANATAFGGAGGSASGILNVTPGDVLTIVVGGMNGYNGGGNKGISTCTSAAAGSGGGASDIRLNGSTLFNRVIIAGGGGGAGGSRIAGCGRGAGGGGGGGYYGGGGGCGFPQTSTVVPLGGTQSTGGLGGVSAYASSQNGSAGIHGLGGNGGSETGSLQNGSLHAFSGGGGGGPNGSAGQANGAYTGQSGAGGSSFTGSLTGGCSVAGINFGNGSVRISYRVSTPIQVTASGTLICINSSVTLNTGSLATYTWSNGSNAAGTVVSPTVSSTYSLNGTNALNCPFNGAVQIIVNTAPPVMLVNNSAPAICPNHPVVLTASGAHSYSWSNNVTNGIAFTPTATAIYTVTGTNGCGLSTTTTTVALTPLPVIIVPSSTLVCAGHSALLLAGGATSYTWQPSLQTSPVTYVIPSANSVYTLSGKTGSCSGTATVEISVNPVPALSISTSNSIICSGSVAVLNVSGTANYNWTINGSTASSIAVSPTVTSLFSVTGTNSVNCSSTVSQVIVVKPAPVVTALALDSTVCPGDTARLAADGAATYSWFNGASTLNTFVNPLTTHNYSVTGTGANGCSAIAEVSVNVFTPVITVSSNTTVCSGTPLYLDANGAESYTWSPNLVMQSVLITPVASKIYTVNATAVNENGLSCNAGNTVMVTVNALPVITVTSSRGAVCHGQTTTLSALGAASYTWINVANSTNAAALSVSPNVSQTYTVSGIDDNGCFGTTTFQLQVSNCVGITTYEANAELMIFPNPNNGQFTITGTQVMDLLITNETGQAVKTIVLHETNRAVTISDLANGIYFLTGKSETGFVKQKIVVSK